MAERSLLMLREIEERFYEHYLQVKEELMRFKHNMKIEARGVPTSHRTGDELHGSCPQRLSRQFVICNV